MHSRHLHRNFILPRQVLFFLPTAAALALLVGCNSRDATPNQASAPTDKPTTVRNSPPPTETAGAAETPVAAEFVATTVAEDILRRVREFQQTPMPSADFEAGHATVASESELKPKQTDYGFVVQFPSQSPIPPAIVLGDRIYIGGGFNSESYHCLDADTGEPVWDVELDDDGPTSAVPHDDIILFGTESCTVFGLELASGKLRWSAYLGDPLLSTPSIASGRMVTVYPAAGGFPKALEDLRPTGQEAGAGAPPKAVTVKPKDSSKPGERAESRPEDDRRLVKLLEPTHLAICLDASTGAVIWRTWLDSDCLTAPVIDGDDVYIVSLSGNLYQLSLEDGQVRSAYRLEATSAPVVTADSIYLTRRASRDQKEVGEVVERLDRKSLRPTLIAATTAAPYLDPKIQMKTGYAAEAVDHGTMNGFGGGGFGGGFAVADEPTNPKVNQTPPPNPFAGNADEPGASTPDETDTPPIHAPPTGSPDSMPESLSGGVDYSRVQDLLGFTELQAAENIGMGNASTIQGFFGSLTLLHNERLYNVLGDKLTCSSSTSGEEIWSLKFKGDCAAVGGHLAAPPALAGKSLVLATYHGDVLVVDLETSRASNAGDSSKDRWTGKPRKIVHLPAHFRQPPVVSNGRIYVTSQDGRLFCVKTGDDSLTGWSQMLGGPKHNQAR